MRSTLRCKGFKICVIRHKTRSSFTKNRLLLLGQEGYRNWRLNHSNNLKCELGQSIVRVEYQMTVRCVGVALKPSNSNIKNLVLDSISGKGMDYDVECYKCRDFPVTEAPVTSNTPVSDATSTTVPVVVTTEETASEKPTGEKTSYLLQLRTMIYFLRTVFFPFRATKHFCIWWRCYHQFD